MLSCDECRRWIVDIKTATKTLRGGRPQARKANQPTPCQLCPKGSPANESRVMLSKRNERSWQMFLRARAGGLTEAEKADDIVQRTLSTCQEIYDQYLAHQRSRETQTLLGALPASTVGRTEGA